MLQAEPTLALFVAEHCAVSTIGNLGEACKQIFHDSQVTSKIKNVFGLHFQKLLREDIADQKYSVLNDESTNVSVVKVLGIVMRCTGVSLLVTTFYP